MADHTPKVRTELPKSVGWALNPKIGSPFWGVGRQPQVMTRAAVSMKFNIETGAQSATLTFTVVMHFTTMV